MLNITQLRYAYQSTQALPIENIPLRAQAQLAQNCVIKKAIPLALGDSYSGFRIVDTTLGYLAQFGGVIAQGKLFDKPMRTVFGAQAQRQTPHSAPMAILTDYPVGLYYRLTDAVLASKK